MQRVKWLHGGAGYGYGYFKHDVCELSDNEALELAKVAMVVIIPATEEILPDPPVNIRPVNKQFTR